MILMSIHWAHKKNLLVLNRLSDKTFKHRQCSIKEVNKKEKFDIFKVIVMLHASLIAAFMKVILSIARGNSL